MSKHKIITGIYKITSPSGKVYIGSSININDRLKYYKSYNCQGQIKLYYSLKKYSYEKHKIEILEECSVENLYERERHYGDLYNVLDSNGMNCILPNNGEIKRGVSNKTRLKMSVSKKGELNSFFGKTHSQEVKDLISKSQIGRKHTFCHKWKVSKNHAKSKSKLVVDLNTGIFFDSCTSASVAYAIKNSTLRSMLNGTNKNRTSLIYV